MKSWAGRRNTFWKRKQANDHNKLPRKKKREDQISSRSRFIQAKNTSEHAPPEQLCLTRSFQQCLIGAFPFHVSNSKCIELTTLILEVNGRHINLGVCKNEYLLVENRMVITWEIFSGIWKNDNTKAITSHIKT